LLETSVFIKRPVAVVAIVTEAFKAELIRELQESIDQVTRSQEALESQARRYLLQLQSADLAQSASFRRQIDAEKARQEQMKQELTARLEEARNLTIGDEFPRGTVESYFEAAVGDNLMDKLSGAAIVVKDDIIVEIRGE
jgi:hypothetical protein